LEVDISSHSFREVLQRNIPLASSSSDFNLENEESETGYEPIEGFSDGRKLSTTTFTVPVDGNTASLAGLKALGIFGGDVCSDSCGLSFSPFPHLTLLKTAWM